MAELIERARAALASTYEIDHVLGRGGMASVFLAQDVRHHRSVAIKVLDPELAAILGKGGRDVPRETALDLVLGYAVMFDITARDLQEEAKAKGQPWTASKGFDTFAPISAVAPAKKVGDPHAVSIRCEVNGRLAFEGNTRDMVHKLPELIARASRIMTLEPGDVLATGTPGIHEIRDGDALVGAIDRVGRLEARVARKV